MDKNKLVQSLLNWIELVGTQLSPLAHNAVAVSTQVEQAINVGQKLAQIEQQIDTQSFLLKIMQHVLDIARQFDAGEEPHDTADRLLDIELRLTDEALRLDPGLPMRYDKVFRPTCKQPGDSVADRLMLVTSRLHEITWTYFIEEDLRV